MKLTRANLGPVIKAKETLKVFARNTPSPKTLFANRTQRFDQLHLILPSTTTPERSLTLTIQVWDQCERLLEEYTGSFAVATTDPDSTHPDSLHLENPPAGIERVTDIQFATPGVHYVTLTDEVTGDRYVSNPVRVTETPPQNRVYWGDIHLHTRLSDGTGTVGQAMAFGKDVMQLDVVACTDHDTMGFFIPPSLQRRRMQNGYFEEMKRTTAAFHEPGEFVTLLGYEWTKQPNMGGHINVYFDGIEEAELLDSMAAETDTYEKLWGALRAWNDAHDIQAITIPHHSAESMYPFDFDGTAYDDELAPLVEVYSVWGSSERPATDGNPHPLAMGQGEIGEPGYYVQDALEMGHRVGLAASADFHGPRPGHSLIHADPHFPALAEWREQGIGWGLVWRIWNEQSYPGGLQAFVAPELTREAIFESLVSRRVYGTTQPDRILLEFEINGVRFGESDSTVTVDTPTSDRTVSVRVAGTAPITNATVVKNNDPWKTITGTPDQAEALDSYTVSRTWTDTDRITGMQWDADRGTDADTYYLRVAQANGGMAWAGPVWVSTPGPT